MCWGEWKKLGSLRLKKKKKKKKKKTKNGLLGFRGGHQQKKAKDELDFPRKKIKAEKKYGNRTEDRKCGQTPQKKNKREQVRSEAGKRGNGGNLGGKKKRAHGEPGLCWVNGKRGKESRKKNG